MNKLTLAAVSAALLACSATVQADEDKKFNGAYIGGSIGYLDIADFEGGVAYEGFLGYRKQSDNGLVLGIEGTFGSADLEYLDNVWSVNGSLGWVVGEEGRGLMFVSGGYAEAKASAFGFSDTNGSFRADIGYEHALGESLSLRVKATTFEFDDYGASAGFVVRF